MTIASGEPAGGGTFVAPTELGIRAGEATMPQAATEIPNPIEQETLVRLRSKVAAMENSKS